MTKRTGIDAPLPPLFSISEVLAKHAEQLQQQSKLVSRALEEAGKSFATAAQRRYTTTFSN